MSFTKFAQNPDQRSYGVVTVAAEATKSSEIDLHGNTLTGFKLSGTMAATFVSFEGSIDGVNFSPIRDEGAVYQLPATVNVFSGVSPFPFLGMRFIKFVLNTAQASAQVLTIDVIAQPL